jgi:glycosyltransferase involved in cell wall biosynthesis
MLTPLALSGRGPGGHAWGGILASTRCHYTKVGMDVPSRRLKDWGEGYLLSRLLNNRDADMVFTVDPYLQTAFPHGRLTTICDASPPFGEIEGNLRHDLGIAPDDIVLLLYGHIDNRKALDLLCEALADPRVQQNVHLLVVGAQAQNAGDILARPPAQELRAAGRLHEISRFVSESEEAAAFAAADIVWVYYPNNFWGSGVMVRGGRAGKPVISTAKGVIGHTVRHQGTGVAVAEENIEGVVAAITGLATDSALRARLGTAGRNYYQDATPENFARPIVESVERHFEGNSHPALEPDRMRRQ